MPINYFFYVFIITIQETSSTNEILLFFFNLGAYNILHIKSQLCRFKLLLRAKSGYTLNLDEFYPILNHIILIYKSLPKI